MKRRYIIWLTVLALGAGLWAVGRWVVTPSIVLGESMTPTLRPWDFCLLHRGRPYTPRRGDIVMFRTADDPPLHFIKRVIALPGETLSIQAGRVAINGEPLAEPYTAANRAWNMEPLTVPAGTVFVLSDNRDYERDAYVHGLVATRLVLARLVWQKRWKP